MHTLLVNYEPKTIFSFQLAIYFDDTTQLFLAELIYGNYVYGGMARHCFQKSLSSLTLAVSRFYNLH